MPNRPEFLYQVLVECSSLAETRKGSDASSPGSQPQGGQRDSSLKIAIVDESPIRAAILEDGLREAGFTQVQRIAETHNLLVRIYAMDPDVILIDLESPSRDMLEQMFQMSRAVKRPVAMFVDQSDTASIQAAVDAGVQAMLFALLHHWNRCKGHAGLGSAVSCRLGGCGVVCGIAAHQHGFDPRQQSVCREGKEEGQQKIA